MGDEPQNDAAAPPPPAPRVEKPPATEMKALTGSGAIIRTRPPDTKPAKPATPPPPPPKVDKPPATEERGV